MSDENTRGRGEKLAKALTLDPSDQARRRRRARINQQEIADRLQISLASISKYETGQEDLPWELTPEDYEAALVQLLAEKERGS